MNYKRTQVFMLATLFVASISAVGFPEALKNYKAGRPGAAAELLDAYNATSGSGRTFADKQFRTNNITVAQLQRAQADAGEQAVRARAQADAIRLAQHAEADATLARRLAEVEVENARLRQEQAEAAARQAAAVRGAQELLGRRPVPAPRSAASLQRRDAGKSVPAPRKRVTFNDEVEVREFDEAPEAEQASAARPVPAPKPSFLQRAKAAMSGEPRAVNDYDAAVMQDATLQMREVPMPARIETAPSLVAQRRILYEQNKSDLTNTGARAVRKGNAVEGTSSHQSALLALQDAREQAQEYLNDFEIRKAAGSLIDNAETRDIFGRLNGYKQRLEIITGKLNTGNISSAMLQANLTTIYTIQAELLELRVKYLLSQELLDITFSINQEQNLLKDGDYNKSVLQKVFGVFFAKDNYLNLTNAQEYLQKVYNLINVLAYGRAVCEETVRTYRSLLEMIQNDYSSGMLTKKQHDDLVRLYTNKNNSVQSIDNQTKRALNALKNAYGWVLEKQRSSGATALINWKPQNRSLTEEGVFNNGSVIPNPVQRGESFDFPAGEQTDSGAVGTLLSDAAATGASRARSLGAKAASYTPAGRAQAERTRQLETQARQTAKTDARRAEAAERREQEMADFEAAGGLPALSRELNARQ